ncbi:unnamed protein product [Rotaria magnacalcarata]|uniref:DDE Tnp4 domain-containing protein n=1 Tax=Rotaria magnacalcarata TaxID=392030 RepID=A0A816CEL8_9BILA|nr:unnamed protein product [Rotaria magnacalcarata]
MPREERYGCFRCEGQINHGNRKHWAGGYLLLRVFLTVNSERRVNPDDSNWGACRRRYDRWRKAMQNDFDHLDVPVNKTDSQENEESMLMEVDTDIVTENEDIESEKEESQEEKEMKSVTLSIWRTSKSHGSCIVCPVADSTSMRVLSDEQRTMIFLSRSIWVPKDFRDTVNILNRPGLQVAMPGFLHNKKQLPADEANRTRLVTKNQWVIESVNGKIKQWKFMAQIIQKSTIRFISDYLDIICALINKYQCPAVKDIENGREIAMKMREMLTTENRLQERLAKHTGTTSLHWSKHNAANFQFTSLTEENIRDRTFGSYQIRMAKFYIIEHIRQSQTNEEEMEFLVELCNEHDSLVRARFQSCHSNNKKHIATVQFDNHKQHPIDAWYCTCSAGALSGQFFSIYTDNRDVQSVY